MISEWTDIVRWSLSLLFPAIAGLVGVWVGAKLTDRREVERRRHDFVARQLSEFYAPLLGIRMEIRARNDLRNRISELSGKAWGDLVEGLRGAHVSVMQELIDKRGPEFSAIIDHDNQQLRDATLPAYRRMVEIFRDKLWLAEPETRPALVDLIEFVDIWDRFLAQSLPHEVLTDLKHSEEKLRAFYANLQATHDGLRSVLSGKA